MRTGHRIAATILLLAPAVTLAAEPPEGGILAPEPPPPGVHGVPQPVQVDDPPLPEGARLLIHGYMCDGEPGPMAFSPDGTLLAIGRPAAFFERAGSVLLVDASHWKLIVTIESPDATFYGGSDPASLSFSSNGKRLAVAWDSSINVYETDTGGELKQFQKDAELSAKLAAPTRDPDLEYTVRFADYLVAFGQGDRQLVAVDSEGGIHTWDLSTGQESVRKVRPHKRLVMGISPTGMMAFESSNQIHLWDIGTRAQVRSIARPNSTKRIYHVKASSDGKILAADMAYVVRLWSLPDGNPLQDIGEEPPEPPPPKTMLERFIRYCFGSTHLDSSIHHNLFLEFCGSKPWLATGGMQGEIIVWDIKTGKQIGRFDAPKHEVKAIAFSYDGKLLVAAYRERTLLWNLDHLHLDR